MISKLEAWSVLIHHHLSKQLPKMYTFLNQSLIGKNIRNYPGWSTKLKIARCSGNFKTNANQHSFPHDLHNCSSPHSTNAHFLGIAMDQKWCIFRIMCVGAWSQLSIKIIRVKHLFCHSECFLLCICDVDIGK